MALTKAQVREILSAAGVDREHMSDVVDKIIDGHLASINVLREEADKYKGDAEKLPKVQKELDDLKAAGDGGYKEKYEKEHKDFEDFKTAQKSKETKAAKEKAYRELLKEAGVSEKRIDSVMKVSDMEGIELVEGGKIKDSDKHKETIKKEWSDFIVKQETGGARTDNPHQNDGGGGPKTREEIYAKDDKGRFKLDAGERQKALAELMANEN